MPSPMVSAPGPKLFNDSAQGQNGFVRSYALSVLLGVVFILGYLILK